MKNEYEEEKCHEYAILIKRLSNFFPINNWQWNNGEVIRLDDITRAIHKAQPEEIEPFGDDCKHPCLEERTTEWHIGRILYFVNHPEEIKDIEIDNLCEDNYILPIPVIIDGNHRFMATMWLNNQGLLKKVYCRYGGRTDVLDYLTGETNICPEE